METIELIKEILPSALSILACFIAFFKGQKIKLTAEEIEQKEEAKKQKRILKQYKKNKINTPIEKEQEVSQIVNQINNEDNYNAFKDLGEIKIPKVGE